MASSFVGFSSLGAIGLSSHGSIAIVAPPGVVMIQAAWPQNVAVVPPAVGAAFSSAARADAVGAGKRPGDARARETIGEISWHLLESVVMAGQRKAAEGPDARKGLVDFAGFRIPETLDKNSSFD